MHIHQVCGIVSSSLGEVNLIIILNNKAPSSDEIISIMVKQESGLLIAKSRGVGLKGIA